MVVAPSEPRANRCLCRSRLLLWPSNSPVLLLFGGKSNEIQRNPKYFRLEQSRARQTVSPLAKQLQTVSSLQLDFGWTSVEFGGLRLDFGGVRWTSVGVRWSLTPPKWSLTPPKWSLTPPNSTELHRNPPNSTELQPKSTELHRSPTKIHRTGLSEG